MSALRALRPGALLFRHLHRRSSADEGGEQRAERGHSSSESGPPRATPDVAVRKRAVGRDTPDRQATRALTLGARSVNLVRNRIRLLRNGKSKRPKSRDRPPGALLRGSFRSATEECPHSQRAAARPAVCHWNTFRRCSGEMG